ncbi:hypothetical protein BJL96_15190 [Burkholderia cenocepacia]|nr:hypothetical protein A3203_34750 [Burkholderia cenocepacia]MCW5184224.1 DUF4262 domain-containing protein [Burkholderia cenocepacia]NGO95023.1 hypothetical protein [Burkholderia cenocepacia]
MNTRPDIATALDAPDSVLDEDEQRFVHQIRQHGWFRTEVFAEDDQPGFSFTTGLWVNHGFPEIIVFSLPARRRRSGKSRPPSTATRTRC